MKKFRNIALIILLILAVLIISLCTIYNINIKAVDKNDSTKIEVVIPSGTSKKNVGKILEEKDLIRSSTFFEIYIKLFNVKDIKASTYYLSKDMDLKEIISILEQGNSYNPEQITITFKEGINIREFATVVKNNTNNTYDDVINLLKEEEYLDELIDTYWFITDEIKNEKIYYSLEGYLFPDTYYFSNKDVSIKEIIAKMLDRMEVELNKYKTEIENSDLSVHQLLTLASIIEKEGKTNDFGNISSVFHNRLALNMSLGSCATAYYGMGLDFNEIGIATNEMMQNKNDYNTYVIQGLPVGAISLPGKEAIEKALMPGDTEYLYFLSDNQGVTYFFETYKEHQQKQQELKQEGKWER